jgi:hypothetical protein
MIATSHNRGGPLTRPISHRLLSSTAGGRTGGQTTQMDSRSQGNRASRRGGQRKGGSQPIAQNRPALCVLPESPCPTRSTLTRAPDRPAAPTPQFHAPKGETASGAATPIFGTTDHIVAPRDPPPRGPAGRRQPREPARVARVGLEAVCARTITSARGRSEASARLGAGRAPRCSRPVRAGSGAMWGGSAERPTRTASAP